MSRVKVKKTNHNAKPFRFKIESYTYAGVVISTQTRLQSASLLDAGHSRSGTL